MKTAACALAALGLLIASPALADEADAAERAALCVRSVELSGMSEEMDRKISAIVDEVTLRISPFAEDEASIEAYKTALGLALDEGKTVIVQRMVETCATAFTAQELNGINAFYVSPAGKAWLQKGREVMAPALEAAVAEVQPQIEAQMQARFCAAVGGCAAPPEPQQPQQPRQPARGKKT